MQKITFFVGLLGVFSMTSALVPIPKVPTINPIDEFAKAMLVAGQTFLCGVHSCNDGAIDRGNSIVCNVANNIAQLKVPVPISFIQSAYLAVTQSIETDANCVDYSYRSATCHDSKIPNEIVEAGNQGLRVGAALDCVKNVTNEDLHKVNESIVEYHRNVANSEIGTGLQCSQVMSKSLATLAESLENICAHI